MSLLAAALLGIVEGITEFLPISSTGHLIIAEKVMGIPMTDAVKSFDIIIQLGAICAAVVVYAKTIRRSRRIPLLVLSAFVPTAVLGAVLHHAVKAYLLDPAIVAWSLFIGGIALIAFEVWYRGRQPRIGTVEQMPVATAVAVGIMQTLAVIPGTSRSAATIVGGMLLGIERSAIVDFSFLLAIPTMLGATTLDLVSSAGSLSAQDALVIAVGFLTAFLSAYGAIQWLLKYIQSHTFLPFGVYRIAAAIVLWTWVL